MRDEFGEIDPDEIDLIDPIGVPMDEPSDGTPPPAVEASPPPRRRRWAIPTAVIALAAAGVAMAIWQPWSSGDDGAVSFPGDTVAAPTLTEELVLGDPPAELSTVSLGMPAGDLGNGALFAADSEGYFFAAQGASFEFGQGTGTWAAFLSVPDGSEDAPDITADDQAPPIRVQGAPAAINNDAAGGAGTIEIEFGPVGGRLFSVITSGIGRAESLRFAEAVGVDGGIPVVRDSTVLGEMEPVGSLAAYAATFQLYAGAFAPLPGMQGAVVAVRYGADDQVSSVASIPAPADDPFPMVRFVLGGEAKDVTVHGLPAVAVDARELGDADGFLQGQATVVTWVEGGRLVMVTGPGDIADTVALAETVRAATDEEWAAVIERSNTQPDPDDFGGDPADDGVELTIGVDPDSRAQYTFTAKMDANGLSMCVQESADGGSSSSCTGNPELPLPVLTTYDWNGHRFALAVVAADEADSPELHITNADGTVEIRSLDDRGDAFPGPVVGVLLPDDVGTVELYNAGEVVASL